MTKFYTGIGHRKVDSVTFSLIIDIAKAFRNRLLTLRSGGAEGCDTAFEIGSGPDNNIYLPWNGFNGKKDDTGEFVNSLSLDNHKEAEYIANMHHPNWSSCSSAAKLLHTRNVYQVLGFELNNPSQVLVCWAEPCKKNIVKGGTGTAVRIAYSHGVPVYNIWLQKDLSDLKRVLRMYEGS